MRFPHFLSIILEQTVAAHAMNEPSPGEEEDNDLDGDAASEVDRLMVEPNEDTQVRPMCVSVP